MARFTTLYSGSSGNCAVIEHNEKFLLVDMGGSCKATLGGLVGLGLTPRNLCGILITHEHTDHIKGLNVFLKKVKVPVFGTPATLEELEYGGFVPPDATLVGVEGDEFMVEDFLIRNFETSHDAAGPCGWRVTLPGGAVAVVTTDLGHMQPHIFAHLEEASLVALESNYDPEMLRTGRYPAYLKNRIASPMGHLSNRDAAQAVARLIRGGCRKVALCHLSAENNRPALARQAVEDALVEHGLRMPVGCVVQVSRRFETSDWIEF